MRKIRNLTKADDGLYTFKAGHLFYVIFKGSSTTTMIPDRKWSFADVIDTEYDHIADMGWEGVRDIEIDRELDEETHGLLRECLLNILDDTSKIYGDIDTLIFSGTHKPRSKYGYKLLKEDVRECLADYRRIYCR